MEISLSSCGHTCTHLGILIAGEVEEKEELKNLLMWGKFSFHVMVDRKLFTYVKNKKQLTLIVNYTLIIFNPLIVWNNPSGVDVSLTEETGG